MVLQSYALSIAVGQLTKDRCKENCDILKRAVDNMPPAEVAIEARKVKEELRKFCQLPDKISHSVTLLNNTKPLLQAIRSKLGWSNTFYLSLSTQVVGNALHNIIEEVNQAQNAFGRTIEECKRRGINSSLIGSTLIDNIKPVVREAWNATLLMDSFDMEYDFKTKRYNPNRQSLKEICEYFKVSTSIPILKPFNPGVTKSQPTIPRAANKSTKTTPSASSGNQPKKKWYENGCLVALIAWVVIGVIAGAICEANDGDFAAGFFISGAIVLIFSCSN